MSDQLAQRSGGGGWTQAWSIVSAARDAAAQIAAVPGADDDLAYTYAALDLTFALAEIEHLDTLAMETTPNFDAATGADLEQVSPRTVNGLVVAAQLAVAELGAAAGAAPSTVLASARVRGLLGTARSRVAGGIR